MVCKLYFKKAVTLKNKSGRQNTSSLVKQTPVIMEADWTNILCWPLIEERELYCLDFFLMKARVGGETSPLEGYEISESNNYLKEKMKRKWFKKSLGDFSGGPAVETLPSDAEDTASIPGFHPWSGS